MSDDKELNAYTYGPALDGAPRSLVILLHGLGADGQDLIGLAPELARAVPDAVFVSPDAPFPCDMAPMGRQWFSLQERDHETILKGMKIAAPILTAFIGQQMEKYAVPAERVVLLGFSQGTMMSLYVGPRYPEKLGGILGYSGVLITADDGPLENLQKIPVYLTHGEADPIVPVDAFDRAMKALTEAGFDVDGHTVPALQHGIDGTGITAGQAFLQRILQ